MIFEKSPVILAASSVVGEKEGQGPLGQYFDHVETDPKFGTETWEQAESTMQLMAAEKAIKKAGLSKEQLDFLFAGDLLGQLIATSFGLIELERPVCVWGLFHHWRIPASGIHGPVRRCRQLCFDSDFEPFCRSRKAVSLSFALWQSETVIRHLDRCRQRCSDCGSGG